MSTARRIILLLIMTSLSGCSYLTSGITVKMGTDCLWFKNQKLSDETIAWLTREDWPDYVREDLDKIADNNDLAEKYCE